MNTELNPAQLEAVEYGKGHLLVLAGAGSGKTRVLVHRIAKLIGTGETEPHRILSMTFTNKAAGEMKERVHVLVKGKSGVLRMGTFHSICAWILRREAHTIGFPENFSIFDGDDQKTLLRRLLKKASFDTKITPGTAIGYISRQKNSLVDFSSAADSATSTWERDMAAVYSTYQNELRKAGAFDFDDLLTQALSAIRQDTDIFDHYSNLFSYILVDEYQDTNLVQRELLRTLTGSGTVVTVVGDDDQSIYAWRGARVENILEFEKDFPGARVIRLERNYRSSGNILTAASALVGHNRRRLGKRLWTESPDGAPVKIQQLYSPGDEAQWVMEQVEHLISEEGVHLGSIAILYRTNAQSREFETAARRYGLHYEVIGSVRFYERAEIKDVVSYLRLVVNPRDSISLRRVINSPSRGIGQKGQERFFAYLDESGLSTIDGLLHAKKAAGLSPRGAASLTALGKCLDWARKAVEQGDTASLIVDRILKETGILERYRTAEISDQTRLENLGEFRNSVADYDSRDSGGGLPGFLTEVSLLSSVDEMHGEEGRIALMTLHCAKGLEFECVFVAGLEEGMLPFVRPGDKGPADIEEERRLLYVGMTRAMKRLHLTLASSRIRPGVRMSGPSRFISEIAQMERTPTERGARREQVAAERSVPVPTSSDLRYGKGNLVNHPRYGLGLLTRAVRRGEEWELTVDFGLDEPKILLTGYVPIVVVKLKGSLEDLQS